MLKEINMRAVFAKGLMTEGVVEGVVEVGGESQDQVQTKKKLTSQ